MLVAVFVFLAVVLRSRFGRALAGIRVNEQRMRAAGFSTYPYKLAAFVLSGLVAGLAGFLFAVKDGFVNPELMGWNVSGTVLMMIILGGIGELHGAVIGAFAFSLLGGVFQARFRVRRFREALASRAWVWRSSLAWRRCRVGSLVVAAAERDEEKVYGTCQ